MIARLHVHTCLNNSTIRQLFLPPAIRKILVTSHLAYAATIAFPTNGQRTAQYDVGIYSTQYSVLVQFGTIPRIQESKSPVPDRLYKGRTWRPPDRLAASVSGKRSSGHVGKTQWGPFRLAGRHEARQVPSAEGTCPIFCALRSYAVLLLVWKVLLRTRTGRRFHFSRSIPVHGPLCGPSLYACNCHWPVVPASGHLSANVIYPFFYGCNLRL